jgi:hypothetical protein
MSNGRLIAATMVLLVSTTMARAESINSRIVKFLEQQRGARVGGGECAHAASEALRISGGEFVAADLGKDTPAKGDYVWGKLIKHLSCQDDQWKDSHPAAKVLPGDIVQYGDARFVDGKSTWTLPHHTSIVAAVDPDGMPTLVYQQNANHVRTVEKDRIDFTKLAGGWVRIYRPQSRKQAPGRFKFSLVNNVAGPQEVTLKGGGEALGSVRLSAADTEGSYTISSVSSSSKTSRFALVLPNDASISIESGSAYELYVGPDEKIEIRKLPD